MSISRSPYLPLAAVGFGSIGVAFGLNAILRPMEALSVFEFAPPASEPDRQLVQILSAVYGVRDIFMSASIAITAYFARGNRPALGWLLVAASACAAADGVACKLVAGRGQWNHWSYAWIPLAIGGALLGVVG